MEPANPRLALTENQALSYALPDPDRANASKDDSPAVESDGFVVVDTSTEGRVGLFFHTVRGISNDKLSKLVRASLNENIQDTFKLLFYVRDGIRGQGKGERDVFYRMFQILLELGFEKTLFANIEHIPFYGSYKDLLHLCAITQDSKLIDIVVSFYAKQIENLWNELSRGDSAKVVDGLAAKWCPGEGKHFDKALGLAKRIRETLGWTQKEYRQRLTKLRETKVFVVEKNMCKRKWEDIEYNFVPGIAFKQYTKTFKRHDPERLNSFLQNVKANLKGETAEGRAKLNTKSLLPHEIYKQIRLASEEDVEVYELMWESKLEQVRETLRAESLNGTIAVADVSGSMHGLPMDVSISLSYFLSLLIPGAFHRHIISFHEKPQLHCINADSLKSAFTYIEAIEWGGSTNIEAVFELILEKAQKDQLNVLDIPENVLILSDMEFNAASSKQTNWQSIEQKFVSAVLPMPRLIFWNLRSSSLTYHIPTPSDAKYVSLISGFNPATLQAVFLSKVPTPYGTMRSALDDPRFSRIVIDEADAAMDKAQFAQSC